VEGIIGLGQPGEDAALGGVRPGRDLVPADFARALGDLAAEDIAQELRAQAHAEDALARFGAGLEEAFFRREPGEFVLFVDVHGAAHDDEEIEGVEPGQGLAVPEVRVGEGVAVLFGPNGYFALFFKTFVTQAVQTHGRPPHWVGVGCRAEECL
jgi:hypothetical protein